MNERTIFFETLDLDDAERVAFLDRACGGDAALRQRIEALLRCHAKAGDFLASPAPEQLAAGADTPEGDPGPSGHERQPRRPEGPLAPGFLAPSHRPGSLGRLGHYEVLEVVGQGGMGIVYRAEQQQPVRRRVALKVLRPGMDSLRQVIARFEAERQALALMEHPNIARVLDAGEAPPAFAGGLPRPYFVMELVEGVPLTDFCDQQRLTPRERLGLFTNVCQAVQHAHQKGIIHRDLKPSNVLVARVDGVPVVKVIDFGIAKAIDQRLTDKTLETGIAQVIGTPLYMSPEQAGLGLLDVDTRSDIYSLGVLLYELLTGTTPFDRERLSKASFDELRQIIREEEPPRPSARLSTLGPAAVTLSEQRRTDPRQLGELLRGELDWVVMKCLEKQRSHRYQTADALARDVGRYLADEPVEACPPSAGYRLGKFLRKHRRPLVTAVAFLVLLAAAGVLAGWHVVREARAEIDRAVDQAKRDGAVRDALGQVRALRQEARKERDTSKLARAREQAQRAQALVESGPADEGLVAQVRQVQEELDEEQKDYRFSIDLEAARLAQSETVAGESRFARERAVPLYRKAFHAYGLPAGQGEPSAALARLRQRPPQVRQAVTAALDDWIFLASSPRYHINEPHLDWLRALAAAELDGGRMNVVLAASLEKDAGKRQARLEKLAAAADVSKLSSHAVVQLAGRLLGEASASSAAQLLLGARQQYPDDFWVNQLLGLALQEEKPPRLTEAVRYLTVAVSLRPTSPGTHLNLGSALTRAGQLDEASDCFKKAIDLDRKYAAAYVNLVMVLSQKRKHDEAMTWARQAVDACPRDANAHNSLGTVLYGAKRDLETAIACFKKAIALDPRLARGHANLGQALAGKGQVDQAIRCFQTAIDIYPGYGDAHRYLGDALRDRGQYDQAAARYRRAIDLDPDDVNAHLSLGALLCDVKHDFDGAIACFNKAIRLDPRNASAQRNLGTALNGKGQYDLAIASYRQAIALEPRNAPAHTNLGFALIATGKVEEGIACYKKAIALDPRYAAAHANLGDALKAGGQYDEAIACYQKAIALDPNYVAAHANMGSILCDVKHDLDGAIACFKMAIASNPRVAGPHVHLGQALALKGQYDQAILSLKKAIAISPTFAAAHGKLGNALALKGQCDEAIACYRKAITLAPNDAVLHLNLGSALADKGKHDEAFACYRKSIALDPKFAAAHGNLGGLLYERGQLDEAIACFRQAARLDPRDAPLQAVLGRALLDKGLFAEARNALARALELLPDSHPHRALVAGRMQACRHLLKLEERLPRLLRGETHPSSAGEGLDLATMCRLKQLHAGAVRFFAFAYAADPRLAGDLKAAHRHRAACSAALAAAGQGRDADKLSGTERLALRRQALTWLRADLALLGKQLDSGQPAARAAVQRRLRHAQQDRALAVLRDKAALARLPALEQKAFAQLWADVAALLAKTAGAPK
jgi:tetratricopeptide (TPR) repeat protein/serine/threonine protein kinase